MSSNDTPLEGVVEIIRSLDPDGSRTASVLRSTLDQLYDGQRTGRYRWDQLHKTEKTHCGTLVEINMQREFLFDDGQDLDFWIADEDVDCKYSQSKARWMIPLEARGKLLLGLWCDDEESLWSMGVVRADESVLSGGSNRDRKTALTKEGRESVVWLFDEAKLPPNVLLHLPRPTVDAILSPLGDRKGAERIRRLFRHVQGVRISRTAIETVAQQKDSMKRIRGNGGAREALRPEGIIILGQFTVHQQMAQDLDLPVPQTGESVAARLCRSKPGEPGVHIEGEFWRLANADDPVELAPDIPYR